MFSGIIRAIGTMRVAGQRDGVSPVSQPEAGAPPFNEPAASQNAALFAVEIESELFSTGAAERVQLGDSIAVSGVCLTVSQLAPGRATFDVSSETLRRTTLGLLRGPAAVDQSSRSVPELEVNLEPALRLGDRLDGHLVTGHVDGVCELVEAVNEPHTVRWSIAPPVELLPFIAQKGSVTIDGVSLTVGEVGESRFAVYLVPYTVSHTTFRNRHRGDVLNIEVDIIARYIHRQRELAR